MSYVIKVPTAPLDPDTLLWFRARDILLGDNDKTQNIPLAAALASGCTHPDARWLTELFQRNCVVPANAKDAQILFSTEANLTNDRRALCFGGLLFRRRKSFLDRAASLGYTFALLDEGWDSRNTLFKRSLPAAQQLEPKGWAGLHFCFERGIGVNRDVEYAHNCLRFAAESGNVYAQRTYARTFVTPFSKKLPNVPRIQLEAFVWFGLAAKGDEKHSISQFRFCRLAREIMAVYVDKPDPILAQIVFQVGESLKGHLTEGQAFGLEIESGQSEMRAIDRQSIVSALNLALKMHRTFCGLTRTAVNCWCIIAKQLGVVRDIRRMIAEIIWRTRNKGLYILDKHGDLQFPIPHFFERTKKLKAI